MVVPGVIGQVVVAFHDMHAGKIPCCCVAFDSFRGLNSQGLAFKITFFSCEGYDAHQRSRFWREGGQGKVTCDLMCVVPRLLHH